MVAEAYTHHALFHDSDDELVDGLVPFVMEGIEADERVVVVVSTSVGELLSERLDFGTAFDLWNSTDVYDTLLGVYALRACDHDEDRLVGAHLATCAECREEVNRLTHVVGVMDHPGGSPLH